MTESCGCLLVVCASLVGVATRSEPPAAASRPAAVEKAAKPEPVFSKEMEAFWTMLAGDDAAKAYRAIWSLVAVPKESVPLLKARLRPAAATDAKQIDQWVADLDSARFAVRKKAMEALDQLGGLAEPHLKKALDGKPSLEARQRIEKLLEKLEGPVTSPDTLRLLRAVEVLEHIATPEARQVLEALAKGAPGARSTREAKESLERLRKRTAHP